MRYMLIAKAVAKGSTCNRRHYGAIIVKDNRILATGYNGAPCGEEHCDDLGSCFRETNNIPHGQQYELCKAVHAEQNAINFAFGLDMIDATMYLYGEENGKTINAEPCANCLKSIKNSQIKAVICSEANKIYE